LEGKVLHYLIDNFCDNIHLLIQPDYVSNFPLKTIKKIKRKKEANISTFKVSFESDINRFIHAKIFIFETDKGSYCLTGSANATFAGLLSRSGKGNVELCLLRYEKRKNAFDYLLKNNEIKVRKIPLSALKENILKSDDEIDTPDIYIEEAKLEGNKLILRFFPPVKNGYKFVTLTITRPVQVKPISIKQTLTKKDQIVVNLSDEQKNFCEQSSFVALSIRKGASSKVLKSNERWISTQIMENIPSKRDLRLIEKTSGRIGLIKLMNRLDGVSEIPTMLLYYLQYLDFDWLADSLDRGRRRIMRRVRGEEGSEDESINYDRFILSAEEVLEKIVNKHEKKFEHMIEEIEGVEDLEERARKMFDLFAFLNKVELWFLLRKEVSTEKLYDIIQRMRLLVGSKEKYCYMYSGFGYFDKAKENIGKKAFLKLHSRLDVLPQFMVLSQVILNLAKKTNKTERQKIEHLLAEIIRNAGVKKNIRREIKNLEERNLIKAIEEYEEFEHFSFSVKKLLKKTLDLIGPPASRRPCSQCDRITAYRIDSETFLCPKCAKKQFGKKRTKLILKVCRTCGRFKWVPMDKMKLEFCKKDNNLMIERLGKFYIPLYS